MRKLRTRIQVAMMATAVAVGTVFGNGNIPVLAADTGQTVNVKIQLSYGQTEARGMLDAINEFRQGKEAWAWDENDSNKITYSNLGELKIDPVLEQVAMLRAAEIALSYSHTRPNGQSCFTAYSGDMAGGYKAENIAAGYSSADAVFEGWQETEEKYSGQGHRRNMLGSSYVSVGIGHVTYQGIQYWVQEFSSQSSGKSLAGADDSTMIKELEVLKTNIQNLVLSKSKYSLTTGENVSLKELKILANITDFWSYRSDSCMLENTFNISVDNERIASIKNGILIAESAGTTMLTVNALGQEIQIPVTVTEVSAAPTESLKPSPSQKPDATRNPTVSKQTNPPEFNETTFTQSPIPTNAPIPAIKLFQPFDIGVVANVNKALTTEVADPQAANGKIRSSVFGSMEYWNRLKTYTFNNATGLVDYGDHKQTFYETPDASIHITETGEYNLTVTALGDSEDLTEDGAIWLEIIPNIIPVNYKLSGHSITVGDNIYAWGAKVFEEDLGNMRLFVCNQWEIDGEQKSIKNPVKSVIPVKRGDKITFTFSVLDEISTLPDPSGKPGQSMQEPTQSPVLPPQEPEMPTQEPVLSTQEPEMPTHEPVLSTQEPEMSPQEPVLSPQEPGTSTQKPSKPTTQPDDNDLTDDVSELDLKVRGLDIATDNVVKKGFLSVPRVQLTWDNNRNCDGYEIWRKEGNKSFVKVDYIDDSDETEWFDTNLKKGCKYTYKVLGYVEEDDGTISCAKDGNSVSVKVRQTVKSCTYTAKRTGKKLKITFKKAEGTKYQIQVKYGKSKKWKKASGSLKKKIVKKVSPKKLKVRVRTCEKVNGKMKYSKWSKVKTVR